MADRKKFLPTKEQEEFMEKELGWFNKFMIWLIAKDIDKFTGPNPDKDKQKPNEPTPKPKK